MKRTYVRVKLALKGSWRIASWESDAANMMCTLRDSAGNPTVPGSGITGMLRSALGESARDFFGPSPQDYAEAAAAARKHNETPDYQIVSPWWILGTITSASSAAPRADVADNTLDADSSQASVVKAPRITTRRRTRIDRARKAAAEHGLFDTHEVDKGEVTVYFRADDVEPEPFLDLLATCNPRVGGGRTIGLGTAKISEIRYREIEFSDDNDNTTKETFLEFLLPSPPVERVELPATTTAPLSENSPPVERVERLLEKGKNYKIAALNRTSSLTADMKVDRLAITNRNETCIHGSTIKGILRSRVEYIGRSMGYQVCGDKEDDWTGCGECSVCAVFGHSGKPGTLEFGTAKWISKRVSSKPNERVRIAIDRFTGGTRSGALFTQQYFENVRWELKVFGHLPDAVGPNGWIRAALLHTLRDIDDGFVTFGPEGAAGYGRTHVDKIKIDGKTVSLTRIDPVPEPADSGAKPSKEITIGATA